MLRWQPAAGGTDADIVFQRLSGLHCALCPYVSWFMRTNLDRKSQDEYTGSELLQATCCNEQAHERYLTLKC